MAIQRPPLGELSVASRDWRLPAMAGVSFLKLWALASTQCGARFCHSTVGGSSQEEYRLRESLSYRALVLRGRVRR